MQNSFQFQTNGGNNMFFNTYTNGMGQSYQSPQHSAPQQQENMDQGQRSNVIIDNHNIQHMIESNSAKNLTINGHNNTIGLTSEVTLHSVTVNGHNNTIYCLIQPQDSNLSHVDSLQVLGHNNRIENLTISNLVLSGHNNKMLSISTQNCVDIGTNNSVQTNSNNQSSNAAQAQQHQQSRQQRHYGHQGVSPPHDQFDFSTDEDPDELEEPESPDDDEEWEDQDSEEQNSHHNHHSHQQQYQNGQNRQGGNPRQQHNQNYNQQHYYSSSNGNHQQQQMPNINIRFNGQNQNQANQNQANHNGGAQPQGDLVQSIFAMINNLGVDLNQMNLNNPNSQANQQFYQQNYQYQNSDSSQQHQQHHQYDHQGGHSPVDSDEFSVAEEEEEDLDEDGNPLPSPEEIKNIINSISSFAYKEEATIACAICLEDLKSGQQVKALGCAHLFHGKCINSWLKQKLKCPLCKIPVHLA